MAQGLGVVALVGILAAGALEDGLAALGTGGLDDLEDLVVVAQSVHGFGLKVIAAGALACLFALLGAGGLGGHVPFAHIVAQGLDGEVFAGEDLVADGAADDHIVAAGLGAGGRDLVLPGSLGGGVLRQIHGTGLDLAAAGAGPGLHAIGDAGGRRGQDPFAPIVAQGGLAGNGDRGVGQQTGEDGVAVGGAARGDDGLVLRVVGEDVLGQLDVGPVGQHPVDHVASAVGVGDVAQVGGLIRAVVDDQAVPIVGAEGGHEVGMAVLVHAQLRHSGAGPSGLLGLGVVLPDVEVQALGVVVVDHVDVDIAVDQLWDGDGLRLGREDAGIGGEFRSPEALALGLEGSRGDLGEHSLHGFGKNVARVVAADGGSHDGPAAFGLGPAVDGLAPGVTHGGNDDAFERLGQLLVGKAEAVELAALVGAVPVFHVAFRLAAGLGGGHVDQAVYVGLFHGGDPDIAAEGGPVGIARGPEVDRDLPCVGGVGNVLVALALRVPGADGTVLQVDNLDGVALVEHGVQHVLALGVGVAREAAVQIQILHGPAVGPDQVVAVGDVIHRHDHKVAAEFGPILLIGLAEVQGRVAGVFGVHQAVGQQIAVVEGGDLPALHLGDLQPLAGGQAGVERPQALLRSVGGEFLSGVDVLRDPVGPDQVEAVGQILLIDCSESTVAVDGGQSLAWGEGPGTGIPAQEDVALTDRVDRGCRNLAAVHNQPGNQAAVPINEGNVPEHPRQWPAIPVGLSVGGPGLGLFRNVVDLEAGSSSGEDLGAEARGRLAHEINFCQA